MSAATGGGGADQNPQAGAGRQLPKRETDIFKNVVKHYEMKQYKKAVKQADTILKKYPNHGETLAMKGLTLNYMNRKEEAHQLVKEGLRNDMRSHVCWHVYGLLHRSDHDYNEAIKAYKQALRVDPKNLQILRDLSMLQIQMRDLDGFAVTRNTLLALKPNAKVNWMAFALARHMTGDLAGAAKVIDIYLGTMTENSAELGRSFESSELALYKNMILSEIPNNYKETLEHLSACEAITVDQGAWLLKRAEYQVKIKDYEAARQSVYQLFERGMTENHHVHSLFMCLLLQVDNRLVDDALSLCGTQTLATMMPLSDEKIQLIVAAYRSDLTPRFPKSHAIQRIPTTMFEGEDLRRELDARCRVDLARGVPSLCSELHSFLWTEKNGRYVRTEDPVDVKGHPRYKLFVEMVDGYVTSLELCSKFNSSDEDTQESVTLLWAWFLRAGLHELAGEYGKGIMLLDKCLDHTADAVDVYELKARLVKAIGNLDDAVSCLDKGREMDLQDRYINNQTTKYMLQAGQEELALKRISLFTRHEGNPEQNLFDMQCCWYELEFAACLARKEAWGPSLKKYAAVVKHFDDFQEDQFDFHSYCLRKVTLRSYVSLLRYEDVVYGQNYFCEAAAGIIRIYLHLYDNPASNDMDEPDYSKLSTVERKKAKAIARKKKKVSEKKETDAHAKVDGVEQNDNNKKGPPKAGNAEFADVDPTGKEFLSKDPLEEARKYSNMLSKYAPKNLQTWVLQYDVAVRRKKPMLALQAIFKGRSIDHDSSEIFTRTIDFTENLDRFGNVPDSVRGVIASETPELLGNETTGDFIKSAAAKVRDNALTDLPMRTAIVKAVIDYKAMSIKEAAPLIVDGGVDSRKVNLYSCREALSLLKSLGSEAEEAAKEWQEIIRKRFPSI